MFICLRGALYWMRKAYGRRWLTMGAENRLYDGRVRGESVENTIIGLVDIL